MGTRSRGGQLDAPHAHVLMSNHFAPARSSTPPNSYTNTLVQRSAVSDVSRSSALSAPELAKLTPDEVEFLDAVISRAPPSATTFIHIFKAYNDVISERGLDAENEVDYYKKLLKIGTLKGENWASKWRTVRAQNGYTDISLPSSSRAKLPLRKPIPTPTLPPRIQAQTHLPSSRAAPDTPRPQSSTARLLQRLKTLQREETVEPSDSAPDDILSQTDFTDAGTDSVLPAGPPPARGRSSSDLTVDNNTLGLDIGATSAYPPSSTLAPSKATGWRWSDRDLDIEKSVPFLTSTPPLPSHKLPSRPTPASIVQQISNSLPVNSTPRRPPAELRNPKQPAAVEDEAWNRIRVAQDERTADRFRNARLLQRCLDVWLQGHDWVTVRPFCFVSGDIPKQITTTLSSCGRRRRQFKLRMRAIRSCSASLSTSGALRCTVSASERRMQMLAPRHIARKRRLYAGTRTCRRDRRLRGAPTCVRACRQCVVCAMRRCGGMRGRTGADCIRVAFYNNALRCV